MYNLNKNTKLAPWSKYDPRRKNREREEEKESKKCKSITEEPPAKEISRPTRDPDALHQDIWPKAFRMPQQFLRHSSSNLDSRILLGLSYF